jgi:hypothetical protein
MRILRLDAGRSPVRLMAVSKNVSFHLHDGSVRHGEDETTRAHEAFAVRNMDTGRAMAVSRVWGARCARASTGVRSLQIITASEQIEHELMCGNIIDIPSISNHRNNVTHRFVD